MALSFLSDSKQERPTIYYACRQIGRFMYNTLSLENPPGMNLEAWRTFTSMCVLHGLRCRQNTRVDNGRVSFFISTIDGSMSSFSLPVELSKTFNELPPNYIQLLSMSNEMFNSLCIEAGQQPIQPIEVERLTKSEYYDNIDTMMTWMNTCEFLDRLPVAEFGAQKSSLLAKLLQQRNRLPE